jgi:hypothetical protein
VAVAWNSRLVTARASALQAWDLAVVVWFENGDVDEGELLVVGQHRACGVAALS